MNTGKKVVVIGGGFGGLATAILLGKDGHDVTLIEKNDHVGGRASLLEKDGFVWDMGPSRYLMPDIFEKFFEAIGEKVSDHLTLHKLTPQYRIFFEEDNVDGKHGWIDVTGDLSKDIETFEKIEPGVRESFLRYLERSEEQYEIGMKFASKNYDSFLDFVSWEMMTKGMKLGVFTTFINYIKRYFKTSKLQKIVQYPLVFLGTAPDKAPALYNIMSHVDFNLGLFYPDGGIYEIVRALEKIALTYNVKIKTSTPATRILVDEVSKKTYGVETDKGTIHADLVVCNADMAWAETHLLQDKQQTYNKKYWDSKTFAPSAFIMYLGVKGEIHNLLHHTLIFSEDWKKNFGAIFDKKELPDTPSLYICCPSKTDTSVAPEGHENLFVLVPIPNGITITQEQSDQYEKAIFDRIESTIGEKFYDRIVQKEIFTLKDFSNRYNARNGVALGLAHTMNQSAIFRPNNVSKKVPNLFYVGHNTLPGIGMPMVLMSGQLVHERIVKYLASMK